MPLLYSFLAIWEILKFVGPRKKGLYIAFLLCERENKLGEKEQWRDKSLGGWDDCPGAWGKPNPIRQRQLRIK